MPSHARFTTTALTVAALFCMSQPGAYIRVVLRRRVTTNVEIDMTICTFDVKHTYVAN